jgi:hypothetical protein
MEMELQFAERQNFFRFALRVSQRSNITAIWSQPLQLKYDKACIKRESGQSCDY